MNSLNVSNNEIIISRGILETRQQTSPLLPGEIFLNYKKRSLSNDLANFNPNEIWVGTSDPYNPIKIASENSINIAGNFSQFFNTFEDDNGVIKAKLPGHGTKGLELGSAYYIDDNLIIDKTISSPGFVGGDIAIYVGNNKWWNISNEINLEKIDYSPNKRGNGTATFYWAQKGKSVSNVKEALDDLFENKADLDESGKIFKSELPSDIVYGGYEEFNNHLVNGTFEVQNKIGKDLHNTLGVNPLYVDYESSDKINKIKSHNVDIKGDINVIDFKSTLGFGQKNEQNVKQIFGYSGRRNKKKFNVFGFPFNHHIDGFKDVGQQYGNINVENKIVTSILETKDLDAINITSKDIKTNTFTVSDTENINISNVKESHIEDSYLNQVFLKKDFDFSNNTWDWSSGNYNDYIYRNKDGYAQWISPQDLKNPGIILIGDNLVTSNTLSNFDGGSSDESQTDSYNKAMNLLMEMFNEYINNSGSYAIEQRLNASLGINYTLFVESEFFKEENKDLYIDDEKNFIIFIGLYNKYKREMSSLGMSTDTSLYPNSFKWEILIDADVTAEIDGVECKVTSIVFDKINQNIIINARTVTTNEYNETFIETYQKICVVVSFVIKKYQVIKHNIKRLGSVEYGTWNAGDINAPYIKSSKSIIGKILDVEDTSTDSILIKSSLTNKKKSTFLGESVFNGNIIINNTLNINGDIFQNENFNTHTTEIYNKGNLLYLRENRNNSLLSNEFSGLKILNYNGTDNTIIGIKSDGIPRIRNKKYSDSEYDSFPIAVTDEVLKNNCFTFWNENTKRISSTDMLSLVSMNENNYLSIKSDNIYLSQDTDLFTLNGISLNNEQSSLNIALNSGFFISFKNENILSNKINNTLLPYNSYSTLNYNELLFNNNNSLSSLTINDDNVKLNTQTDNIQLCIDDVQIANFSSENITFTNKVQLNHLEFEDNSYLKENEHNNIELKSNNKLLLKSNSIDIEYIDNDSLNKESLLNLIISSSLNDNVYRNIMSQISNENIKFFEYDSNFNHIKTKKALLIDDEKTNQSYIAGIITDEEIINNIVSDEHFIKTLFEKDKFKNLLKSIIIETMKAENVITGTYNISTNDLSLDYVK